MLVTAPRPRNIRATRITAAATESTASTTVTGVTSGPPSGAGAWPCPGLAAETALLAIVTSVLLPAPRGERGSLRRRGASLGLVLVGLDVTLGHPGQPAEEDDGRDQAVIDRVLHRLGLRRERPVGQRRIAELVERDAGQHHHLRAAEFLLTVDVVDIARGDARIALVRAAELAAREGGRLAGLQGLAARDLGLDVRDLAEQRRTGRADLGTRRIVALGPAVVAQLALDDLRQRAVVLEARHAERARGDAVAAADAGVLVVAHDAGALVLLHRVDRARRHARRVDAVHARLLDERVAVGLAVLLRSRTAGIRLDHRDRLARDVERRVPEMLLGAELGLGVVGGAAGADARLAAYAQRRVEQQPDRVGRQRAVAARRNRRRRGDAGRGGRGAGALQEMAPVHGLPALVLGRRGRLGGGLAQVPGQHRGRARGRARDRRQRRGGGEAGLALLLDHPGGRRRRRLRLQRRERVDRLGEADAGLGAADAGVPAGHRPD